MSASGSLSGHVVQVGPREAARGIDAVLESLGWSCVRADSPAGVLRLLRREPDMGIVLITPHDSVDEYIELCRSIKFDTRTALVLVIFVLPNDRAGHRAMIFEAGADDCIQLPAPPNEIVARLRNAARIKSTTDSLEDATTTITALANAIEGKDAYTRGHVERVATYALEIGRRTDLDPDELATLKTGALVHDVGKVAIPDHILNKPGRLTAEEMDIVKRHPLVGYDILKPLRTFRRVLPIVRWHHERPNGTGYPDGLSGGDFPLLPRIMAVADVFDAISSDRPYRKTVPLPKCREILARAAEEGDLDPELVSILCAILDEGDVALRGGLATTHAAATAGFATERT